LVFLSIILSIILGYLSPFSFLSLVFIFPAIKATRILKKSYDYKIKLIQSSKLTILVHTLVSAVLILDVLLCIK
jgi:1,4-dihydroxy-2-naphthoate octaprenyltransferase